MGTLLVSVSKYNGDNIWSSQPEKLGKKLCVRQMPTRTTEVFERDELSSNWHNPVMLSCKRALDVIVSGSLLILLSPLFFVLAATVRLTSAGPVLYRWPVVGRNGRHFFGWKFRTMHVGADKMREQLRRDNEMTGPFFKLRNDPRVTSLGRILRRYSLDELPQLWSVFIGNMSLVGPRPTQDFEFEQLTEWQKKRVTVKPGAVSSWIVTGKTRDFDEMVRLDLMYIKQWSIWMDLRILAKAVPYVLLGRNY